MSRCLNSSLAKLVLAHGFTVLLTLSLATVFFHAHSTAQHADTWVKAPQPQRQNSDTLDENITLTSTATAVSKPQAPPPPKDILDELDPDERNNVKVYAAANKGVVNITT